ncbi:MAG: DUF3667 domain-containing protein [Gemmatimonadetes bacterium]|nr:DUF3667 domain-containing protein [Gemmatimonadota bacterium]
MPNCANCGAGLGGRYCPRCGQDSKGPPQNAVGLIGFFTSTVTGLESKAVQSFITLMTRPGRLTRAYIDGQRVRYSSPVQLYLWCTAFFFLVQAISPVVRLDTDAGQVVSSLSAVSIGTELSPETLRRLEDQGTTLPVFAERFDAAVTAYFPILLIALVAAAALMMALQFWGETALTHAVFALHWAAFYFMLEVLRQLLPRLGDWVTPVSVLTTLVAVGYLYAAMRLVYRRGRIGTVVRALLSIIAFAALLGTWLWSTIALAEKIA